MNPYTDAEEFKLKPNLWFTSHTDVLEQREVDEERELNAEIKRKFQKKIDAIQADRKAFKDKLNIKKQKRRSRR